MSDLLGKSLQRSKRLTRIRQVKTSSGAVERWGEEREIQLEAEDLQAEQRVAGAQGRGNLKSIWESNALDNFLDIADAREKGYEAERNTKVVFTTASGKKKVSAPVVRVKRTAVPNGEDDADRDWDRLHGALTIPRRPAWDYNVSPEAVQQAEEGAFLDWRRTLAHLEEKEDVLLTPYEKNLQVWRQLWRVVERADVVLQLVDARNPLVYRCPDFEKYVSSTVHSKNGKGKMLIVLLNKADLLTEAQRREWAAYYQERGIQFFFFSAKETRDADEVLKDELAKPPQNNLFVDPLLEGADSDPEEEEEEAQEAPGKREKTRHKKKKLRAPVNVAGGAYSLAEARRVWREQLNQPKEKPQLPPTRDELARDARLQEHLKAVQEEKCASAVGTSSLAVEPWTVLDPVQLVDQLALLRVECGLSGEESLMAGLVGYPNVGKSSTINAIIGAKKVVVSATPGKTKHFQTLSIPHERRVMLCDCPGLVFPSLATTREAMICDGILPTDHSSGIIAAVAVLCRRLPRRLLEVKLNISLHADDDVMRSETLAERLLNAYARRRGYITDHDRPNQSRAGKDLLKWFVDGVLIYVAPPPSYRPDPSLWSIDTLVSQSLKAQAAPTRRGGEEDEEDDDDASWCSLGTEEEEAWKELEAVKTAHARGFSDEDDDEDEDNEVTPAQAMLDIPFFYARPSSMRHHLSREEAFNHDANKERIRLVLEMQERQKVKKKATNAQMFSELPDTYTFINREGEVELRIDDDDGVIELVRAADDPQPNGRENYDVRPGAPSAMIVPTAEKKLSKRQQRRLEKKHGGRGIHKVEGFE